MVSDKHNAWSPGIQSTIPASLWPLVTVFRKENSFVSYDRAKELADLTGLEPLELIAIRPERLVVHALLIRVTADLSVPDGPNYEDLGISLRGMVHQIFNRHMQPKMAQLVAAFDTELQAARAYITELIDSDGALTKQPTASARPSLWQRLLGTRKHVKNNEPLSSPTDIDRINHWRLSLQASDNELHTVCLKALIKTADKIVAHRSRLPLDQSLLIDIVVNEVGNSYGAEIIGNAIEPIWQSAIVEEAYRKLPAQNKPVIMNTKGASASGKSTIRPQQRLFAEKLGIAWEDFALISPDYWRKYLLDYDSLGDSYKYGAMLNGHELEIIDKKLDRYVAGKASRGDLPHLLIDRFRFDSFVVDVDSGADSKLLSRFGDRVYLFIVVTHPAETVERAWKRGIKTGRYKAVDDLLYHNVEAYTGIPNLFFSWINSKDKLIHFEFLDNDVPEGELPRTAAFGWNDKLTILDVGMMINIDRYRKVNFNSQEKDCVLAEADLSVSNNMSFIRDCVAKVRCIHFVDQQTAECYAVINNGKLSWWSKAYLDKLVDDDGLVEVLTKLGYNGTPCDESVVNKYVALDIADEKRATVGRWCVDSDAVVHG